MAVKKLLVFILLILLISQAGLIFAWWRISQQLGQPIQLWPADSRLADLPIHDSYFSKKEYFDEAYQQAEGRVVKPDNMVYGGIIPHHLIVKDKIAAFFKGLEGSGYKTVILIGPNHFNQGRGDVILSQARWQTPYGLLDPDLDLIDKLSQSTGTSIEEYPFAGEHAISGLVSFIKKSLPQAKLVPVILKYTASTDKTSALAKAIKDNTSQDKTLVIASVDFSHYLPTAVADFHDWRSNAIIADFDFTRIASLEIDSPPSIYALLKYLELNGRQGSQLLFSTNSGRLGNQEYEPGTSHNIFYFTAGEKANNDSADFLFFGDLMLDRYVGKRLAKDGLGYLLDNLAGQEKRFFMGLDFISCNLEGAVTNQGAHYSPSLANDFAFSPDLIKQLAGYNFNFFNLANNHFTDQGERGIKETRNNLGLLGFNYSGCPDGTVGDCSFWIMEVAGHKVGLAGFSMVYQKFDLIKAKEIIGNLAKTTNLVITNIHWGTEYQHQFNKAQQQVAHELIDAGADVIIGHHPHVIQGLEVYREKPIFYSLGNFVFDQYFSLDTQQGLAIGLSVDLSLEKDKRNYQFYLYPIQSKADQVELMGKSGKNKILEDFIKWSEVEEKYKGQIREGKLAF